MRFPVQRPSLRRLLLVSLAISTVSTLGFLLALAFQWPSHFVLGPVEDSVVDGRDLVVGTVASIPLTPWLVLVAVSVLAASRRWWGTVGVVALALMGLVFVQGGWGEAFGPANPDVPYAVRAGWGLVWAVLGVALSTAAGLELVDRVRARRSAPHHTHGHPRQPPLERTSG